MYGGTSLIRTAGIEAQENGLHKYTVHTLHFGGRVGRGSMGVWYWRSKNALTLSWQMVFLYWASFPVPTAYFPSPQVIILTHLFQFYVFVFLCIYCMFTLITYLIDDV